MVATPPQYDRPLTVEDLEAMPDDGQRYELLQGELIVSPSPSTFHQRIHRRLNNVLNAAVSADKAGEVFYAPYDVRFSEYDVVEPDFLVVAPDQHHRIGANRFEGVPLLTIEITSPSSGNLDRVRKAALYNQAGVAEYWIVETDHQRIVIHRRTETGSITEIISTGDARSNVVPSFVVNLTALFQRDFGGPLD